MRMRKRVVGLLQGKQVAAAASHVESNSNVDSIQVTPFLLFHVCCLSALSSCIVCLLACVIIFLVGNDEDIASFLLHNGKYVIIMQYAIISQVFLSLHFVTLVYPINSIARSVSD